jgi:hypothetical protein
MTDDDIIRSWDDRIDDRPRSRVWPRRTRIIDGIAWRLAFAGYIATLIWAGVAAPGGGAASSLSAAASTPQFAVLTVAILGLMGFLASWALVALVRAIRR